MRAEDKSAPGFYSFLNIFIIFRLFVRISEFLKRTDTFSEKIAVQMKIQLFSNPCNYLCQAQAGILCWQNMNVTLVAKFNIHCLWTWILLIQKLFFNRTICNINHYIKGGSKLVMFQCFSLFDCSSHAEHLDNRTSDALQVPLT